jgi:hypothetical protein
MSTTPPATANKKPRAKKSADNSNSKQLPLYATLSTVHDKPKVPYTSRYQYELASQAVTSINSVVSDNELRQVFTEKEIANLVEFNPVYTQETLWRYHDGYRNDGAIARAIDTLIFHTLGEYTKLVLDTNEYFQTEDDKAAAADEIKDNLEYQSLVKLLSQINKDNRVNSHVVDAMRQSFIYGKACILKDKNKANIPYCLKTLNSIRLGKVWAWRDTWELAAVEYLDFPEGERVLKAEDIIYFVNKNGHTTPNTYWHGYSMVESVIDIAETNMLNRQTNIRNINETLWAPFITIMMHTKSQKAIDEFTTNYKAGQPFVSNQDFQVTVTDINHDLDKLMNEQEQYDKKIGRDMEVPLVLMGFEDIQTRSTGSITFYGWLNSVIRSLQTWLRDILEPQWIDPNLKAIIILKQGLETLPDISQYTKYYSITDKYYDPKTINPALETPKPPPEQPENLITGTNINLEEELHAAIDPNTNAAEYARNSDKKPKTTVKDADNAADPKEKYTVANLANDTPIFTLEDLEVSMLPFRIIIDFTPVEVNTPLDEAARVIGLFKAGIYDLEKALEELGAKEILGRQLAEKERNKAIFEKMTGIENEEGERESADDMKDKDGKEKGEDNEKVKGLPDATAKADELTNISRRATESNAGGGNAAMRLKI